MSKQVLGDVYVILGVVQCRIGRFKQADIWLKKALKIREISGDKTRIGACYLDLGLNYYQKFNFKMSEKFYLKALCLFEEIGHQQNILYTLNNLGALYANYDLPKAEQFYLKALKKAISSKPLNPAGSTSFITMGNPSPGFAPSARNSGNETSATRATIIHGQGRSA